MEICDIAEICEIAFFCKNQNFKLFFLVYNFFRTLQNSVSYQIFTYDIVKNCFYSAKKQANKKIWDKKCDV